MTPENKRSDVRLSAEERAEKIASSFLVGDQLAEARQGLAGLIAAQIAEAVNEARHCCFAEDSPCNQKRLALWNIKAEAFEEAARIVANAPGNTYATDCDHAALADEIRARAKEVCK
jgi:hypothetical protein